MTPLEYLDEIIDGYLRQSKDPLESSDCELIMEGDDTPDITFGSAFLQHYVAATLANLLKSKTFEGSDRMFA